MKRFGVKTILDLRRLDRPCKKAQGRKTEKIRLLLRTARKVNVTSSPMSRSLSMA